MTRRGNGFGSLINKGEGKPWLARWVYKGQVYYKSTGEVDKKKALKALERITRPYRDAREEDAIRNLQNRLIELQECKSKNELLTEDIWIEYEKKVKNSDVVKGTLHNIEVATTQMIEWMKKKVKYAKDITPLLAEKYLEELSAKNGNGTFNNKLCMLKRMWRALDDEFRLCKNVWDGFKKKKVSKHSSRTALSEDEIVNVLKKAETHDMKLLIMIGMYTGLRISDASKLKWSDIDMEHKIMKVIPIKTKKHMDAPIEIPIHPALMKMLEAASHESEYVSKSNADDKYIGNKVVELFKKCGLKTSEKVNGKMKYICGFHSLRHTFVSMALNNGMPAMLVQKIVGHSAVDMTSHYFHENMDKISEGINALPDVA